MKRYLPILILTGIIAVSAPFMRPATGDALRRHEFVVLQAQEYYYTSTPGTNDGQLYQFAGFYVYNYDASTGAPKLTMPVQDYPYRVTTNQLAQTLANLANEGFNVSFTDARTYVLRR